MKTIILIFATFLLFSCSSPNQIQKPQHLFQEAPFLIDEKNILLSGSGFFIGKNGEIATNYHVIQSARRITALYKNKKYTAKIMAVDQANDLAILKIDRLSRAITLMTSGDVQKGDSMASLSFPMVPLGGQESKASFGHITAHSGLHADRRYYQIDLPIQPGSSGAPLLNYKSEVVGIISGSLSQNASLLKLGSLHQNVNYALKVEYLLALMKKHKLKPIEEDIDTEVSKQKLIKRVDDSLVLIVIER